MYWDPFDRPNRARRRRQQRREERGEEPSRGQGDETPRPSSVSPQVVQRFERELAEARRERDEWADRYQALVRQVEEERQTLQDELRQGKARLQSEAAAQRERLQRNAEQRAFEENRQTLKRLLKVADNLERALTEAAGEQGSLMEGVRLIYRDFHRALEETGVERIASMGQPFDPSQHEAVTSLETDGETGVIVEEIEPGYRYKGILLRPAKVVVSG